MEWLVKANVLNLGSGKRQRTEVIKAETENQAISNFLGKYMTLEILSVYPWKGL